MGPILTFIREVEAPDVILTDNDQTKKWKKTSREHVIKQRATVPNNQQQNQSEGRIQACKNKCMSILQNARVSLEMWCHCLEHTVDCLNHTEHLELNY